VSGVAWVRAAGTHHSGEYADAVVVPAGTRLVLLAGSCPLAPDGSTVAVGDVAGQATACVATLRTALAAAGAGLEDVVSTRVLVATTRQADLVTAWDAVRAALGAHEPPSTLLGVTVLGYDDQLVEVEAVAALPG
jgi:enamine deaminase RidA (YjgF/YER057c/UK114 family)